MEIGFQNFNYEKIDSTKEADAILKNKNPSRGKFKSFVDIYGNNVWHYLAFSEYPIKTYNVWKNKIKKEDFNKINKQGKHFIHYLYANGKFEEIDFFKSTLSDLDFEKKDLLHYVVASEDVNKIKKFISENRNLINNKYNNDGTVLREISIIYPIELLQFFLENGADTNIIDKYGKTPLHYVAEINDINKYNLLESFYADENIKSKSGKLPNEILVKSGHRENKEIERIVKKWKNELSKHKTLHLDN